MTAARRTSLRSFSSLGGGGGALGDPGLGRFQVQLDAVGMIRGQERIIEADLLDEAAVTRATRVRDHDIVVRAFLGAAAGQTNAKCHWFFLAVKRLNHVLLLTAGPETFRAAIHRESRRPCPAASSASFPCPSSSSCPPSGGAS